MTARISLSVLLLLAVASSPCFGQYQQQPAPQQYPQMAGPPRPVYQPIQQTAGQPVAPQGPYQPAPVQPMPAGAQSMAPQGGYPPASGQPVPAGASAIVPQNAPTLQRRLPQTLQSPFPELTPEEQAKIDDVLLRWEEASRKHERICIKFNRFEFKPAFTNMQNVPLHIDQGEADFHASGKWMWKIRGEIVQNKLVEGQRAEEMLFDGSSIYEFNYPGKIVTQYVLDNEMKGEEMVKAMLPFLFGTDVRKLKERYFIRLLEFSGLPQDQVCIDASPRFLDEARNYRNARMIVDMTRMEPTGLMLTLPTGNESYRYQFTEVKINPKNPMDPLGLININSPYKFKLPSGWTSHVEQMSATEVTDRPPASVTR